MEVGQPAQALRLAEHRRAKEDEAVEVQEPGQRGDVAGDGCAVEPELFEVRKPSQRGDVAREFLIAEVEVAKRPELRKQLQVSCGAVPLLRHDTRSSLCK